MSPQRLQSKPISQPLFEIRIRPVIFAWPVILVNQADLTGNKAIIIATFLSVSSLPVL